MHTQERQLSALQPSRLDRLVSWAVRKLTSRHGRRILFITSLYFQAVSVNPMKHGRIDPLKQGVVSRLNLIMSLAKSDNALTLPIALRGIVWKGADLTQILTAQDFAQPITYDRAQAISERVVSRMPACLHYGQTSEMTADVFNLLQNGALLTKAA